MTGWEQSLKPQTLRVLRRLRQGPLNVTEVQELPTFDGLEPILRLAARIGELRKAGCKVRTRKESNGTATYLLLSEPVQELPRVPSLEDGPTLFQLEAAA